MAKQAWFKYHGLLMNKPRGGNYHWVDNHICKIWRFFGKIYRLGQRGSKNSSISKIVWKA